MVSAAQSPTNDLREWASIVPCAAPLTAPGEDRVARIQVAGLGKWKGHKDGPFQITLAHLKSMLARAKARLSDIAVDWNHASLRDPNAGAAGWLRPMTFAIEDDEYGQPALFADARWTPKAATGIRGEEWRLFSPVIGFGKKDRETNEPVLAEIFGGGLTNDPFIDGMRPIALSRLWALNVHGDKMNEEMNAGVAEDAPAEEPAGARAELSALIMAQLGITNDEEAKAYLADNASVEELLEALTLAPAPTDAPAEAPPEQMAANRGVSRAEFNVLATELKALRRESIANREEKAQRAAEDKVIADGVPRSHASFSSMVELSRSGSEGYQGLVDAIAVPTPTSGRTVAMSRAEAPVAGAPKLTPAQRTAYNGFVANGVSQATAISMATSKELN